MASVEAAAVLETVAHMALNTELLQTAVRPQESEEMQKTLLEKHFNRKHGPGAYYGQN